MFSFKISSGAEENLLSEPNTALITPEIAQKYFGVIDPIGKELKIGDKNYTVKGEIEKCPDKSHFHYDILISINSFPEINQTKWLYGFSNLYIMLKEKSHRMEFEEKLQTLVGKYMADEGVGGSFFESWVFFLQPLTDIHLHSDIDIGEFEANGNSSVVYIFLFIAVLIILIAILNFVNLATARSISRHREIGIRKVVGSLRSQLIFQQLGESVLISFISLFLALWIIKLFFPQFVNITGIKISLDYLLNIETYTTVIISAAVVGILAGVYPAFYISSFNPVEVFRFTQSRSNRRRSFFLGKGLISFQFMISGFLILSTFIIYEQLNYIQNKELGYSKNNLFVIKNTFMLRNRRQAFKELLIQNSAVISVSMTNSLPGYDYNRQMCSVEGNNEPIVLNFYRADHDLMKTLELNLAEGRYFSRKFSTDTTAIIINEQAAKEFGWTEPLNKTIRRNSINYNVIGVVKDFHYELVHTKIRKMAIVLNSGSEEYVAVKFDTDNFDSLTKNSETAWKEFIPDIPLNYAFYDMEYNSMYHSEKLTMKLALVFSSLGIFIAGIGLFGFSSYMVERRKSEIGIRKTLGGGSTGIVFMILKEYVLIVSIANIIIWPIAFFLMRNWLEQFAYRIDIELYVFPLSAFLIICIVLVTTVIQTLKAALANPVDTIRYE